MLRSSRSCFIYGFGFQVINEKLLCSKGFCYQFEGHFYMKIIATMVSTNLAEIYHFIPFLSFCRIHVKMSPLTAGNTLPSQRFLIDHLQHKTVNKTTLRTHSANHCQVCAY